jgi:hypothetical protein
MRQGQLKNAGAERKERPITLWICPVCDKLVIVRNIELSEQKPPKLEELAKTKEIVDHARLHPNLPLEALKRGFMREPRQGPVSESERSESDC